MAKQEYSAHQKKVIDRYYENRDTIALGRLQELVTDLYLAESQAKRDRLWEQAAKAMEALKVPPTIMRHILERRDVVVLARNVEDWLKKPQGPPSKTRGKKGSG